MASRNSNITNSNSSTNPRSSSIYTDDEDTREEFLVKIPGAILHLIDIQQSIALASGEFQIVCLHQNRNILAIVARVGEDVHWKLFKDEEAVKLDDSHYCFSPRVLSTANYEYDFNGDEEDGHATKESEDFSKYILTIVSKGQEGLLKELDEILDRCTRFSVEKISKKSSQMLDEWMAKGLSPMELEFEEEEMVKDASTDDWIKMAPNEEDYSGRVARMIAKGSGKMVTGILRSGDITVNRLSWGKHFLRERIAPYAKESEVNPETLEKIRRAKKISKKSKEVAKGLIFPWAQKISGYATNSILNTNMGNKVVGFLQRDVVIASLDGLDKVSYAAKVAGKKVMSETTIVTTELVTHRYGNKAGEATNEAMHAAGYAMGTTWTLYKTSRAINPLRVINPIVIANSAARAGAAAEAEAEAEAKAKAKAKTAANPTNATALAKSTAIVAAVVEKAKESILIAVLHFLLDPAQAFPSKLYTMCCVLVGVFLCLIAIKLV